MREQTKALLAEVEFRAPTTEDRLNEFEKTIGIKLPLEYREFMLTSNGALGFVGNSYLMIWTIEEALEINESSIGDRTLCLEDECPPVVCFGSDGGGMAYAFEKRTEDTAIITFPFISIIREEYEYCGNTFHEFIQFLAIKL